MKIAIIGAGISGLTCAYQLNQEHDIKVFESEAEVGGHTATKDVHLNGRDYAIDTGFIVYNDWTYPNFIKLLQKLNVETQATNMSFSVKCQTTGLEYGGSGLNTLFAQRRNLLRPTFWRMLQDIVRFNKESVRDLEQQRIPAGMTLAAYLRENNYSQSFIQHYLVPMGCAIWSASTQAMLDFPVLFFVRFFKNHGLLSIKNRPQWHVIKGGSRAYLAPLIQKFSDKIQVSSPIKKVQRNSDDVTVTYEQDGQLHSENFEQVIFACHSNQAMSMLADISEKEKSVLAAIPYKNNEVVLHTDTSLLPKNKRAWSSWNYWLNELQQNAAVLTYNMNILQGIKSEETFCVTLNATQDIDPAKVLGKYEYAHPVFSLQSELAANNWQTINGVNKTWFCGAYWGNGFHEDGVVSALRVSEALGVAW